MKTNETSGGTPTFTISLLQNNQAMLEEGLLGIIRQDPDYKQAELSAHIGSTWKKWLKTRQPKEVKDALLQKYPRTGDCCPGSPILNEEIKGSLKEGSLK